MENSKFAKGLFFKRNPNAPDFVVGNLSIKAKEFVDWMRENVKPDGWVNLQVKQSKEGKYYAEIDTWEPSGDRQKAPEAPLSPQPTKPAQTEFDGFMESVDDDLPF